MLFYWLSAAGSLASRGLIGAAHLRILFSVRDAGTIRNPLSPRVGALETILYKLVELQPEPLSSRG